MNTQTMAEEYEPVSKRPKLQLHLHHHDSNDDLIVIDDDDDDQIGFLLKEGGEGGSIEKEKEKENEKEKEKEKEKEITKQIISIMERVEHHSDFCTGTLKPLHPFLLTLSSFF